MKKFVHLWQYLAEFLKRKTFQTNVVEKIKHILYSITSSRKSSIYELMRKNMIEPGNPQMTAVLRKFFACWVSKATNTNSAHIILITFLRQQWLREDPWFVRFTKYSAYY
jgi:hypothetical protein